MHFKTQNFTENSPINYFEYELLTPWKANVSASKIFNKHIIISGDYEMLSDVRVGGQPFILRGACEFNNHVVGQSDACFGCCSSWCAVGGNGDELICPTNTATAKYYRG